MQTFLRSASHDLMMKSREQQTPALERRQEHTASILESNQTGEDCDLFVTFYLSVTYRHVFRNSFYLRAFHLFLSLFF